MIEHVEAQVLALLLIASLVAMGARRLRVPYTLALVLAGLALSFVRLETLSDLELTPDLLLLLFLPPLLFEAAYHLPFEDLRRNAVHIGYLALPGVLIGGAIAAVLAYLTISATGLVQGFGWAQAMLFAAVLSATDPVSVLAMFKELGAPKRLYQVVEGESLINDGVAVVAFAIVATAVGIPIGHGVGGDHVALHGARDIAVYAIVTFVKTGFGGVLVGAATGALASMVTRQVDDHLIEITLTTLVAWGSFLIAEQLHVSGVLSTVSAGIVLGSFGKHYGMSASTRIAVQDFWQYMGFLSNSFIFLLIGLELEPGRVAADVGMVLAGFASLVVARTIVVFLGVPVADRFTVAIPKSWRAVLVWGGLRGSLSMVLVLGLPASYAGRPTLITLVFGVVAVSLFLQGLTMAPLMRHLGLSHSTELGASLDYQMARGQALATQKVLLKAHQLAEQGLLEEKTHTELVRWYEAARDDARIRARSLAGETMTPEHLLEGMRRLSAIEREALDELVHAGIIDDDAGAELVDRVVERLDLLDRAAHHGEGKLVVALDEVLATTGSVGTGSVGTGSASSDSGSEHE
jgi:Na+:H+ antiporter